MPKYPVLAILAVMTLLQTPAHAEVPRGMLPNRALDAVQLQDLLDRCSKAECAKAVERLLALAKTNGLSGKMYDYYLTMPLALYLADAAVQTPALAAPVGQAMAVLAKEADSTEIGKKLQGIAAEFANGQASELKMSDFSELFGPKGGGPKKGGGG